MKSGSRTRRVRPGLDRLEGRELLSGGGPSALQNPASDQVRPSARLRSFHYTTPAGSRVELQLFGVGNLDGTTVGADGALDLRFSGTNQQTGIIARVHGGTGHAPLHSLQSLTLPTGSLSGIGSSLINILDLRDFDLVPGGRINLTGGVHVLALNSVAGETQINLREVPENVTTTSATQTTTTGTSGSTSGTTGPTGGPTAGGTFTTTSGKGTSTTTTVLPRSTTQNGEVLTYAYDRAGGQTLTGVSGMFVPGLNVVLPNITFGSPNPQPGNPPAPPGVVIAINAVDGPALTPNPLSSLSGPYHPALSGAALVDVQGNTQSFKAQSARGLVFSGEGNVNLVKIDHADDTTIIGYPFGHALIPDRTNVLILSSFRTVGTRNGVVAVPNLIPTGPLSLPTA